MFWIFFNWFGPNVSPLPSFNNLREPLRWALIAALTISELLNPLPASLLTPINKSCSVLTLGFFFIKFITVETKGLPMFVFAAAGVAFNLACAANLASFVNVLSVSIFF